MFRNGIIESAEGRLFSYSDGKALDMARIEEFLYQALSRYLKLQQQLAVSPPAVLMLSLLNISEYYMDMGRSGLYQGNKIIHEDTLLLPEELIDDLSKSAEEIMKPLFDRIWNTAGWAGSMSYDANGKRRTQ